MAGVGLALFVTGVAFGCADLPAIESNVCGNGVLEGNEECERGTGSTYCYPRSSGFGLRGESKECRFGCNVAGSKCPATMICGIDNLCRGPASQFATEPTFSADIIATALESGDFDGDKREDLLAIGGPDTYGMRQIRLLYSNGDQPPIRSESLRTLLRKPRVYDFDGDGFADVLATSEEGVSVFRGGVLGALAPKTFARFPFPDGSKARLVKISGISEREALHGETALFYGVAFGKSFFTLNSPSDAFAVPPYAVDQTRTRAENFIERTVKPGENDCDEVLVAPGSDTRSPLFLIEPCTPEGAARGADKPKAPVVVFSPADIKGIPADATLGEVITGDINGDGHADILLEFGTSKLVGLGDGKGTFQARGLRFNIGGRRYGKDLRPVPALMPLAVEPIRSDGKKRQIVLASGIYSIEKVHADDGKDVELDLDELWPNDSTTWTQAIIRDFNRDGNSEVAVMSSGRDVEYFLGIRPGEPPNPSRITTNSLVKFISAGDYDGDGLDDLGIVESDAAGRSNTVSVAYGRPFGPPESPLEVGQLDRVDSVVSVKILRPNIDALVCAYPREKGDQVTYFSGQGERRLLSPFGIGGLAPKAGSAFDYTESDPISLSLGRFRLGAKHLDLATIGIDTLTSVSTSTSASASAPRVWLSATTDELSFDGSFGSAPVAAQINLNAIKTFDVFADTVALDVDNDGVDELVILARALNLVDAKIGVLRSGQVDHGTSTKEWAFGAEKIDWTSIPGALTPDPSRSMRESGLLVADLDGDGRKDLLAHFVGKNQLYVLWNTPAGLSEPVLLAETSAVALGRANDKIQLVLEKADGVLLGRFAGRSLETQPALVGLKDTRIRALRIFDADGDGVSDLAVSYGTRVSVFMGIEARVSR